MFYTNLRVVELEESEKPLQLVLLFSSTEGFEGVANGHAPVLVGDVVGQLEAQVLADLHQAAHTVDLFDSLKDVVFGDHGQLLLLSVI